MKQLIRGVKVLKDTRLVNTDILIDGGIIAEICDNISPFDADCVYNFKNCCVFAGFTDVHVHLREPGFSYKETIKSGTLSAARGGYTRVFSMPNLNPVPDSVESLGEQLALIEANAVINVNPYASITVNEGGKELSDIEGLSPLAVAFSDDGRGVQSGEMMECAMRRVKAQNKIIAAHCEDNSLLFGGYIHKGNYALEHNHKGICSESEWKQIERDISLCEKTGCAYHVCHISTKESVELIRKAKARGVNITCETAPHYLVLSDKDLKEEGRFKMNPPLRDESDRKALIEGVLDGTVDMLATDHAPHSAEEKSKGLEKSAMGIVGLETAFAVVYTNLVKTGILPLNCLIEMLTVNPAKRFGFEAGIKVGAPADLTVFDLNCEYTVDPDEFLTKGRATPFAGNRVFGRCKATFCNGKAVWMEV